MTNPVTVDDFALRMPQLAPANADETTNVQACIDAAWQIVITEVGRDWATPTAGQVVVYADGGDYLQLPPYTAGSVTAVTTLSGFLVPYYAEYNGRLVVTDSFGIMRSARYGPPLGFNSLSGWIAGVPYTVHATFGAAVPADLKEAALEIAIAIYGGADARYSDVVGVDGQGDLAYTGKYPKRADATLKRYRAAATPVVV